MLCSPIARNGSWTDELRIFLNRPTTTIGTLRFEYLNCLGRHWKFVYALKSHCACPYLRNTGVYACCGRQKIVFASQREREDVLVFSLELQPSIYLAVFRCHLICFIVYNLWLTVFVMNHRYIKRLFPSV